MMEIAVSSVRFVQDLYPRLHPMDDLIERYTDVLASLPPIVVARGGILVDGYHRWQAHLRAKSETISVEHLGDLSDAEILNESIVRNARHGAQLSEADKKALALKLWYTLAHVGDADRIRTLSERLSVSDDTIYRWTGDVRREEKETLKAQAWDEWLNCRSYRQIAELMGCDDKTISAWCAEKAALAGNSAPVATKEKPWGNVQHFDVWQFGKDNGDSSYFGRMPPQVVENLLWLYTEPGAIVVDPFAGSGTTIEVAKRMGRRVWGGDLTSATRYPMLPIRTHNIVEGWPNEAPRKADLILLDPPYWQQAKGKYSDAECDLANMSLADFYSAWQRVVKACVPHLSEGGRLAYIIGPTQVNGGCVEDHATEMLRACWSAKLRVERRVIVPYQTQQATGQQVEWARENRCLLKLYRDLVVLKRV